MKFAVIQFPGSNCDQDCVHVLQNVFHTDVDYLWHKENSLGNADAVIVPGGFSYGDYLRSGAIARFSAIMKAVVDFANQGGTVLGICNGFQILCEAGLLPGALVRNRSLQFRCEQVYLHTPNTKTRFTSANTGAQPLRIPIAHHDGCYFADAKTLDKLKENNQILWQYVSSKGEATADANPNGSVENIAGICNEDRNVAGLMPHPERACEAILDGSDGRSIFSSILSHHQNLATPA